MECELVIPGLLSSSVTLPQQDGGESLEVVKVGKLVG